MISTQVQVHRDDLNDRLDTAVKLLDSTHPAPSAATTLKGSISREARGLAVVLLFAAYENLLTSLTRTLLEAAVSCRVSNRRLRPGFKSFALAGAAASLKATADKKLYSQSLPRIVQEATAGNRVCTIDTNAFPNDGSFMKSSQIELWCKVFDVGHPAPILQRTWQSVDSIVSQRKGIAHGRLKPDEVGRTYSETEIRDLVEDWRQDWTNFLLLVEQKASTRDFFRLPR
jgi:hypothetical protein